MNRAYRSRSYTSSSATARSLAVLLASAATSVLLVASTAPAWADADELAPVMTTAVAFEENFPGSEVSAAMAAEESSDYYSEAPVTLPDLVVDEPPVWLASLDPTETP